MNKTIRLPMATLICQTVLGLGVVFGLGACSVDSAEERSQELSLASVAPAAAATTALTATTSASEKAKPAYEPCQADEVAAFDRSEGEEVDLEQETLPRGLYLATVSEMLLEKKSEPQARMMIREIPGGKQQGEVVCAENVERLGESFEMGLSGVVKFETMSDSRGADLISRQFYVFSGPKGHGVVISNSKLASRDKNLKAFLASPTTIGQLIRLDERHFVLKFARERDGVRARLQIRLEMIPQN